VKDYLPAVCALLLVLLPGAACSGGQGGYFQDAAFYSESRRGHSLLVIQQGKTAFESYAPGESSWDAHRIYSGTKSFWGVAAMAAVQDGLVSLGEPVAESIPEWRSDPRKSRITIRELLNFTDGIPPAVALDGDSIPDRDAFAIALPSVAPPGDAFIYGPSHLQIFCEVLRRRLRPSGETPWHYLERKVLHPLGLNSVRHLMDRAGNPLAATGFELTARQWARMGKLVLNRGFYDSQQLVEPGLLEKCFQGSAANPAFGMEFWLNRAAAGPGARELDIEKTIDFPWQVQNWRDACICRDAPADMVVSLGSAFQRLYIVPSLDLVVVRQGENANFSDGAFLRMLLADLRRFDAAQMQGGN
jgi:CubicO group peptidase (beta-lactamase class C family)